MRHVAIRVDATLEMGTGHAMRCLTLAAQLRLDGAAVRFVSRAMPEHLAAQARAQGCEVVLLPGDGGASRGEGLAHAHLLDTSQDADAAATSAALAGTAWDVLVVDHYALDERWESAMRARARRLLVIDDLADRRHDCDALLDQNFYHNAAQRYLGKVPQGCSLLLGTAFCVLRPEFGKLRAGLSPRSGRVQRVLVFFGGVDAANGTGQALAALACCGGQFAVDAVIGPQHPQRAQLEEFCARQGWHCHVNSADMASLMARADMGIGAGGTATWERCALGLPALTLCVADNQRQLVADGAAAGVLYGPQLSLGDAAGMLRHVQGLIENPSLRAHLSRQALALVDGHGARRVARAVAALSLELRPAHEGDMADLYAWRSHPAVSAVSRNNGVLALDEHRQWLAGVLADPARILLIGELGPGQPIGVVRFDVRDERAEVSIYLVPERIGSGLGGALLHAAEQWLTRQRPGIAILEAAVLPGNRASHGLFVRAGYEGTITHYFKKVSTS